MLRLRVRACYGYGYGRATATGTGVLRLRIRACYGYGYGRATATGTGVLRLRVRAYYGYGYGRTAATGTGTGLPRLCERAYIAGLSVATHARNRQGQLRAYYGRTLRRLKRRETASLWSLCGCYLASVRLRSLRKPSTLIYSYPWTMIE